jgi:aminoglycoside 6'-N-acetyltransferase
MATPRNPDEGDVHFRAVSRQDFPQLQDWLSRPHVETWWREPCDLASIEARYGPSIDGDDRTEVFIIDRDDRPIGLIQWYLIDDNPDWKAALAPAVDIDRAAGIDYFIGDLELIGQGLGPRIIDRFLTEKWSEHPHVSAVVVDIDQENRRSWRAIEKAGFRRVWAGELDSDDPSDAGPCYVYVRRP